MKIPKPIFLVCASLLLFALAPLPYGYYTFLRLVVAGVSFVTAYNFYKQDEAIWTWTFVFVGILFNPFIPIHLSRDIWAVIDLFVAGLMIFVSGKFSKGHS